MTCPICGQIAPESRKTCGAWICLAEYHHRAGKRTWADPERRERQSRLLLAAIKAERLMAEVLKAAKKQKVTIQ